jgi:hypothetical protein
VLSEALICSLFSWSNSSAGKALIASSIRPNRDSKQDGVPIWHGKYHMITVNAAVLLLKRVSASSFQEIFLHPDRFYLNNQLRTFPAISHRCSNHKSSSSKKERILVRENLSLSATSMPVLPWQMWFALLLALEAWINSCMMPG